MHTVLSYPRSGQNWVRYILTQLGVDCTYTHDTDQVADDTNLILLLRNYKECILRNNMEGFEANNVILPRLPYYSREQSWLMLGVCYQSSYLADVKEFDQHTGGKHLLYYEDLITDPVPTINKLSLFLGVNADDFLANLDVHIQQSLRIYSVKSKSFTSGLKSKYHSRQIPPAILSLWDRTMIAAGGVSQYRQYLQRYQEEDPLSTTPNVEDWHAVANFLATFSVISSGDTNERKDKERTY